MHGARTTIEQLWYEMPDFNYSTTKPVTSNIPDFSIGIHKLQYLVSAIRAGLLCKTLMS